MALAPYLFSDFSRGLNIRDKADAVQDAECIDALNVEFGERGAVRQRGGYVEFTDDALTNRVDSLSAFHMADGTSQLIAGCGTRLEAIDNTGAVIDSETGLTGGPYSFVRAAAPDEEAVYAGNGSDTLRKWNGTAWSAPTATVDGVAAQAMPEAGVLGVTEDSGRLIATGFGTNATGGPDGTATNPSRVYFSDPSDPESWSTDNWIDLHPGDGEKVQAVAAWSDRRLIFKESKFFVLTQEGTDPTLGIPIFNSYDVESGVGLVAPLAFAVGPAGVYFLARSGVYVTTGNPPTLVSDVIAPIFTGDVGPYFQSDALNHAAIDKCRMAWHDERLYLAIPTGTATVCDRVLVHDTVRGWWSIYDLPASAVTSWAATDQAELYFGYSSGGNEIGRLTASATDDNGTAITSRWRSGWGDYSAPVEKRVRRTEMWGTGTIEVLSSVDWEVAPRFSATVVLGDDGSTDVWTTDPSDVWTSDLADVWTGGGQVTRGVANRSPRGTTFSTEVRNTAATQTWSVHRVVRHLCPFRPPGQHGGNS